MKLPRNLSIPTRKSLAAAYVNSILNYSAFTFISLPFMYHQQLHRLTMKISRWILGDYCFRQSCKSIYLKSGQLNENQIMLVSSLRFIARIVNFSLPSTLFNKLTFPRRSCNDISMECKGKHSLLSYINIGLRAYNKVPLPSITNKLTFKQSLLSAVQEPEAALVLVRSSRL